jgi:hypothetical protein
MLVAGGASAVLGLGVMVPASALAAPGWTPPVNFAVPANAVAQSVQIAYRSGGTATVAYLELVSQTPLQTVLHVGVIPPGGSYQEQLRIPSTANAIPADVSLAEAPNGAAVVEWAALQSASPTAPLTYLASYRPPGGGPDSWEKSTTLAADTTTEAGISGYPVAAISADGTAAAGIEHVDPTIPSPGGYRIDVAVHPSSRGWSTTQQISPNADSSEELGLGFDAHGDLTAAFRLRMPNGRYTLAAVTRPESNGIWGTVQDVTGSDPTSDVDVPMLAVGPDGSAVIAFQYVHYAAPNTLDVNAVSRTGQNGAWTAPVDVAPGGSSSSPLAVGMSPADSAYILYRFQGSNSGLDCVGAVRITASGSTSPTCVSPTNFEAGSGGVSFIGSDAYFAWTGQPNGGTSFVVEGSRWIESDATPDVATNLESPGAGFAFASVEPEQDGNVVAFWTAHNVLRAAAFQSAGVLALRSVSQRARSWRESKRRIHGRKRQPPVGTTFRYALNQGATVTLKFTRIVPGRRVSGVCVRQTRHNQGKPRCPESINAGSLTLTGGPGSHQLSFSGNLAGHRLQPGSYEVTFTAVNSFSQRSTHTLTFTIAGR